MAADKRLKISSDGEIWEAFSTAPDGITRDPKSGKGNICMNVTADGNIRNRCSKKYIIFRLRHFPVCDTLIVYRNQTSGETITDIKHDNTFESADVLSLRNDIMIFDNHNEPCQDANLSARYSGIVSFKVNDADRTIEKVWNFHTSDKKISFYMGSVYLQSNGNVLGCWPVQQYAWETMPFSGSPPFTPQCPVRYLSDVQDTVGVTETDKSSNDRISITEKEKPLYPIM